MWFMEELCRDQMYRTEDKCVCAGSGNNFIDMPGGSGLGQLQVSVPPGASAQPRFAWLTQQGVFQGALQPRPASSPRTPLDYLEDRSLLPFQDRSNQPRGIVSQTMPSSSFQPAYL